MFIFDILFTINLCKFNAESKQLTLTLPEKNSQENWVTAIGFLEFEEHDEVSVGENPRFNLR